MKKIELGAKGCLYPMPVVLAGANVKGKPNYLAIGYCGVVNYSPVYISVSLSKKHYTAIGIRENGTFSVNIPSVEMVKATDYCGVVSGHKVDKSGVFESFYGKLGTAPMIQEAPLNLECKLIQTVSFEADDMFIGEVVEVYTEDRYLTDGQPDMQKIKPLALSEGDMWYWGIGDRIAKAFEVGKGFTQK